jgi:hypothetical protein
LTRRKNCIVSEVFFPQAFAMPKQSLGRNLGTLMGDKPKEGVVPAPVGAGVRSLIQGGKEPAKEPPPPATAAAKAAIPRWYLFAGDVLLVTLALLTIYKSPSPLSWQREVFCGVLVVLAAALAVVALLTPANKAGRRSE